ncbi:MAG TPA: alkaline phosphatase family protein [Pseudolabrys sp.]|nr:alkaline phosphatase family protein [Pseudolabrys sp.]
MFSRKLSLAAALLATALGGGAMAAEGPVPTGIPALDHVFVIMMENHGYGQIIKNPNAPFINMMANNRKLATNFFAVAHPSLTNYLEVVGGSNFGVHSDHNPDWHNASCQPNLATGVANTDNPPTGDICPIAGTGKEAPTQLYDKTNEAQGNPGLINIDGHHTYAALSNISGKTIADQLVAKGLSYKSYQENLPIAGADNVNYSDGYFTDKTDFSKIHPTLNPPLSQSDVVSLYASKHNPFVYFKSTQEGTVKGNSLANSVGFDGPKGLFADLASGDVPNFSLIAPNQCNDQHGRGNAGAFCNYDPKSDGTQKSLNPALIYRGDVTVQKLVQAIKFSPVWKSGSNAIVIIWDENDYSFAPNTNQIVVIVDTNYNSHSMKSNHFYTHYSLLRSIEGGFGLPCLNHACDKSTDVMTDMFAN